MGTLVRRTISIIMSVIMVLSCFTGLTFSVGAETSGDYEYEVLEDGTAAITKYIGSDKEVSIPSEIDGKKVTKIYSESWGTSIFDSSTELGSKSDIISVTIPDGVTEIGYSAFYECSGLANIAIPDSVEKIGYDAFLGCTGLTSVTIPDSVTSICEYAFEGCTGLTSISIPDSVIKIDACAFSGCTGLTSVIIPDSVTRIGELAFYECTKLESAIIGDGVPEIEFAVFDGCTGLKTVKIGNSVTTIGMGAFQDCTELTSVTIPSSVTKIDASAFIGCSGLTSVTIVPGCKAEIGKYAFADCTALKEIYIPSSIRNMDYEVFYGCNNLTIISTKGSYAENYVENHYHSIKFRPEKYEYFIKDDGTLEVTKYSDTDTEVVIPSEINGKEVTSIGAADGYGVFWRCSELKSVTVPSSIKKIGSTVFSQCWSLENIILSDGIEEISDYAFYELGISNIYIPSSVSNIGNSAFYNCKKLERIDVADNNENYKSSDGVLLNKDGTNLIFCPRGKTDEYVIPDGVTEIGKTAFYECTGFTSVTIPESATKIQDGAFGRCSALTEINLPDSVTDIGEYAFSGCTSLAEINIPDSVTNIGESAFMYTALKKINIPGSIKNITQYAFCSCESLEEIYISEGVESIECGAFKDTALNRKITIPRSVTQIDDDALEYDTDKGDYDDGQINTAKTVVYGYKDTEAKRFAKTKRFEFIDIDNPICEHKETEVLDSRDATCTEKGYSGNEHCKNCYKLIKRGTEFPALGHSFENYVADNNATCTKDGTKTAKCERCDVTDTIPDIGSAKGHTVVTDDAVAPTCIKTGLTEGTHCSECGMIFKEQVETPALGHNFVDGVCTRCSISKSDIKYGDLNGDGRITADDARIAMRISANMIKFTETSRQNGDPDNDGTISMTEARNILRYAARYDDAKLNLTPPSEPIRERKAGDPECVMNAVFYKDSSELVVDVYANNFVDVKTLKLFIDYPHDDMTLNCNNMDDIINRDLYQDLNFSDTSWACDTTIDGKYIAIAAFSIMGGISSERFKIARLCFQVNRDADKVNLRFAEGSVIDDEISQRTDYMTVNIKECTHENTIIISGTPATCTEKGYSGDKYCKDCNKLIAKGTEIKALGHKFVNGKCTVCGAKDPNYKPTEKSTVKPTEKTTVPSTTEKPTEKPTEAPTVKPTEPSTEKPIEKPIGKPAEKTTAPTTDKPTRPEKPTKPDSDKATFPATEKPSEVPTEPTTKAEEKLEFADNSNIDGKIDEENKKVSIVPSSSAGISLDDFKALFKGAVSVAGERNEKVFNGMKFTFNGNEYTFILKGDTSPDGKITANDARTILRIAARLEQPDDVTKESADVDSDGKVTSKEARSVLRFAAKLQNKIYE